MKATGVFQSVNKATVGVGIALVLLVLNLAFGNPLFHLFLSSGVSAGTRPVPPPTVASGKDKIGKEPGKGISQPSAGPSKGKDELARYDPSLNLDELKDVISHPTPKLDRNPFELEPTPQELKKVDQAQQAPAPPPPPPAPAPHPAQGGRLSGEARGD